MKNRPAKRWFFTTKATKGKLLNYKILRALRGLNLLNNSGFSILEVQKILNHSSVKIVVDTYGHLIQDWEIITFNKIKF